MRNGYLEIRRREKPPKVASTEVTWDSASGVEQSSVNALPKRRLGADDPVDLGRHWHDQTLACHRAHLALGVLTADLAAGGEHLLVTADYFEGCVLHHPAIQLSR